MPTVLEPMVRTVVGRLVPGMTTNNSAGNEASAGSQSGLEAHLAFDTSPTDTETQVVEGMMPGEQSQPKEPGSRTMQKTFFSRFRGVLKAVSQVSKDIATVILVYLYKRRTLLHSIQILFSR